ncbi:turripeptide Pal9.2-like [Ochlerotatus camptorhynchus]|uniref:turripeptide Pal9.2-like n=1 Tax=Ochlerotatus camptorhynchus TaxID=644619 RepID=UPI0031DBE897
MFFSTGRVSFQALHRGNIKVNMRLLIALSAVLLAIVAVQAGPAKEKPTSKCTKACSFDYTPVCAGAKDSKDKPISFGNVCVMENYNCDNKKSLAVLSQGECPGGGGVRLQ